MNTTLDYPPKDGLPVGASAHRALHVAAWLLLVATFPLIWMGGLVTSHGAGLSVPDWPNSFGYNMFALPWGKWLGEYSGGIFYEHTHRLLGTLVGLLAVACVYMSVKLSRRTRRVLMAVAISSFALALIGYFTKRFAIAVESPLSPETARNLMHAVSGFGSLALLTGLGMLSTRGVDVRTRRLCLLILVAVIVQGLMGGFRVTETSLLLAKLHGIFGQCVFGLTALLVVVTSPWWHRVASNRSPPGHAVTQRGGVAGPRALKQLRNATLLILTLIVTQLSLGALMRHDPTRDHQRGSGAGLAIPDWPLHYGKVLPPTDAETLATINVDRRWNMQLPDVTLGQVWLHFAHRAGAYVTSFVIFATAAFVVLRLRRRDLLVPTALLTLLLCVQVTLGVLTVLWRKPADVATLHQATGALLLACGCVLAARAWRLYHLASSGQLGTIPATPANRPIPGRAAAVVS